MHHYSIITFRWVTTHLPRLLLKSNLTSVPHLAKVGYDIFPHDWAKRYAYLQGYILRTLLYNL